MLPLNTLPIESFLEKARIARRSNQKLLTLSISEVSALEDSLAVVMTRLTGELDEIVQKMNQPTETATGFDGGQL